MTTDTTNALRALDEWAVKWVAPLPADARAEFIRLTAALATAQPEAKPEERAYEKPGSEQVAGDVHRGEAKPEAVDAWECFRDVGYFDLWCVRPRGSRKFGEGFHVVRKEEAHALRDTLNSYAAQRDTRQAQGGGEDAP